jgi:hypothetical protein
MARHACGALSGNREPKRRYYVIADGFSVWADESDAQSVLEAYVSRRQMSALLGTYTQRIVVSVHGYGTEVRTWM